jgi:hypothetical protein
MSRNMDRRAAPHALGDEGGRRLGRHLPPLRVQSRELDEVTDIQRFDLHGASELRR